MGYYREEKEQLELLYSYFPTVDKAILKISFNENAKNFQTTFQEISSQIPASYGNKDVISKEIPKQKLIQKKKSKNTKTIDLHGYTVEQTYRFLKSNLKSNSIQNESLLIITGKGLHSLNSKSILKPYILNHLKNDKIAWKFKVYDDSILIHDFSESYQIFVQ